MATMPNVVGMNYRDAINTLIVNNVIPNDGSVRQVNNPPAAIGYFDPWPVGITWKKGSPANTVTAQTPSAGSSVVYSNNPGTGEHYTPIITLTVNAPSVSVSSEFTAGGFS